MAHKINHDGVCEENWRRIESDTDNPFTAVNVNGKPVFRVEPECGWRIKSILSDYGYCHEANELIVMFEKEVVPDENCN